MRCFITYWNGLNGIVRKLNRSFRGGSFHLRNRNLILNNAYFSADFAFASVEKIESRTLSKHDTKCKFDTCAPSEGGAALSGFDGVIFSGLGMGG